MAFSDLQTFIKESNEARRGHPVTKARSLAIRALDLRQTDASVGLGWCMRARYDLLAD